MTVRGGAGKRGEGAESRRAGKRREGRAGEQGGGQGEGFQEQAIITWAPPCARSSVRMHLFVLPSQILMEPSCGTCAVLVCFRFVGQAPIFVALTSLADTYTLPSGAYRTLLTAVR